MARNPIRLLIVDDDPFTLKSLQMLFKRQQIEVQATNNAISAIEIIEEKGPKRFDCVLTDFRMPKMTGLELVSWLKERDPSLASILLTAEGDKEIVAKALRDGVSDFIEKPYRFNEVFMAVQKAVRATREKREVEETVSEVRDITELHDRINEAQQEQLDHHSDSVYRPRVTKRIYPIKESGGDFANTYTLSNGRLAVLIGDVSGHDLKAGFVSAYFQGMVRGMIEMDARINTIFERFNTHLCSDWNRAPIDGKETPLKLSLAAGFLFFDFANNSLQVANHGLPLPVAGTNQSPFHSIGNGSPPLGWFQKLNSKLDELKLDENGCTYFYSDGLSDYSESQDYNPLSLAWYLVNEEEEEKREAVIRDRIDDILVIKVDWTRTNAEKPIRDPFFLQAYPGNSPDAVDQYQETWEKSISLCIPDISNEKLWGISLSIREALLNAMVHGCNREESKQAYICMWLSSDKETMHFQIRDDGDGYREEPTQLSPDIIQSSKNRHISFGLTIIKSYSERCDVKNNGSCLEIDFRLKDPEEVLN